MAMSRKVIVVGDKVLIKPEEENAKTPSGLYLPQGVASKENVAVTNAAGSLTSPTSLISSTIGRIADFRTHWRVLVETWPAATQFEGRLVFMADDIQDEPRREGPPKLRGSTHEDVLRAAYDLPEAEIRATLRSLV